VIELAVGVAGRAKVQAEVASDEIQRLQAELRTFPEKIMQRYGLRAVKKAAYWGKSALERQVSRLGRKTGNLARAVTVKTKTYKKNRMNIPVPVAVIGYRRSGTGDSKKVPGGKIQIGNDRAFHAHLVEFGTQRRFPGKSRKFRSKRTSVNGFRQTLVLRTKEAVHSDRVLMSSFKTGGPFKVSKAGTNPAYPLAFIASVDPSKGLGAMPALHPLQKAFDSSKATMQSVLLAQLRIGIDKAEKDLEKGRY
jgi:hypothetical protein